MGRADDMRQEQHADARNDGERRADQRDQAKAQQRGRGGSDPPDLAIVEIGSGHARQFRRQAQPGRDRERGKPARPHNSPSRHVTPVRRSENAPASSSAKPVAFRMLAPAV